MRRRNPMRALGLVVLTAQALGLAACSPDPRPTAIVETPLGNQSGNVLISFRLRHRASDRTNVDVIYSSDGGKNFHIATVVDPDTTTVGLDTSPRGRRHSIEWDSLADGVGTNCPVKNARIRIIPFTRADKGRPGTSGDFPVNNTPVSPPTVDVTELLGVQTDEVVVEYLLIDEESDLASITSEWSTDDGQTFAPATATPGSEPTVDLTTGPTGLSHTFTWDSVADVGFGIFDAVRFRITAMDGIGASTCQDPVVIGPFRLDNSGVVPLLYVANPGDPSVSRVDTNTGALTPLFTGASSASDLVVVRQAVGNALMVVDGTGDRVIVLDADTGVLIDELPTQLGPRRIALMEVDSGNGPAQTAYVTNSTSGSISVLDAEGFDPGLTVTITNVGAGPEAIAAAPLVFGAFLYVALPSSDTVMVLDAETLSVFGSVPLDGRLHREPAALDVVEAPNGTFVYVGNVDTDSVAVIDTLTSQTVPSGLDSAVFPAPASIASFAVPGGRTMALVSCPGDDSVRAIDVGAGHVFLGTVPRAAADPQGIVALATQFGSRLYVTDAQTGELGSLDLDTISATGSAFPLPTIAGLGTGIRSIASNR